MLSLKSKVGQHPASRKTRDKLCIHHLLKIQQGHSFSLHLKPHLHIMCTLAQFDVYVNLPLYVHTSGLRYLYPVSSSQLRSKQVWGGNTSKCSISQERSGQMCLVANVCFRGFPNQQWEGSACRVNRSIYKAICLWSPPKEIAWEQ